MKDKLLSGRFSFGLREAVIMALVGIAIGLIAAIYYA